MLSMLDTGQKGNYRVPYSILNEHNPYAIAAYLAAMRFSTRYNEATGSIKQYLDYFSYPTDHHIGATNDRMKSGLITLASLGALNITPKQAAALKPNEHFNIKFKPNWGWSFKEYPLAIMYPIKEIDKAVELVKKKRWTIADSIVDVLELVGYLRSYMETTTETMNPYDRWNEGMTMVDYNSTTSLLGVGSRRLDIRLERMKALGFGRYRKVKLKGGTLNYARTFLLFVNKSNADQEIKVLNKAKRNLLNFYTGSKMVKVETDTTQEEATQEEE